MKQPNKFCFAAILLLLVLQLAACSHFSNSKPDYSQPLRHITILHTNDMHAHMLPDKKGKGGAGNLTAYFSDVRKKERGNVLILDAGDMTQGSAVSTIFKGKPIFEIMNTMGYDAAALGNHEFDNGSALIAEYRRIADFPLISGSAIVGGKMVADAPYLIFEINGVNIGVLGITTTGAVAENTEFLTAQETIDRYLPELNRKTAIVIALTHIGIKPDRILAEANAGIDLIVGGHSHTALQQPEQIGDTIIVQAGAQGRYAGRLDLTYDTANDRITTYTGRLIPMPADGLTADHATVTIVDAWEAKVADKVNIRIGQNPVEVPVHEFKSHIERIWRETYQTDFAIQNKGGTRGKLSAGDILVKDIYRIMPFDNTIVILQLTRAQVAEEIEDIQFDTQKPLYTVATSSYNARYLTRKYKLAEERIDQREAVWRDPIIQYIRTHNGLMPQPETAIQNKQP